MAPESPPAPTVDDLDHALLLAAYMIVADGEIDHDELQFFERAMMAASASEATRIATRAVFSDNRDKIPFAKALAAVPSAAREVVYRQLAEIAWADGILVCAEEELLMMTASTWGLSDRTIKTLHASAERAAKRIEPSQLALDSGARPRSVTARLVAALDGVIGQDAVDSFSRWIPHGEAQASLIAARNELILAGDGYDEAVRRCAEGAVIDYEIAAPALQTARDALKALRIGMSGRVGELSNRGRSKARTSDEVREAFEALEGRLSKHMLPRLERLETVLRQRRRALRDFTVAILGRTKAGKSTLHAVLTGEGWDAIGVGSLRTTRFNRSYRVNGLRIVDTPGIGAPGGQSDVEIARSVVDEADVVVFLVTDDSTQTVELDFFKVLREAWKPLVVLLNVKRGLDKPSHEQRFLRNPSWVFREDDLAGHEARLRRHVVEHYGNDYFSVLPVHLEAARRARAAPDLPHAKTLLDASRIHRFVDHLRVDVLRDGVLRRSQTLLGASAHDLYTLAADLQTERDALVALSSRLQQSARRLRQELTIASQDAIMLATQSLSALWTEVEGEIDGFAEQHWNEDRQVLDIAWKKVLAEMSFESKAEEVVAIAGEAFLGRTRELLEEMAEELRLTVAFQKRSLDADGAAWGWTDFARKWSGRVLTVAGTIALLWTPMGWAAIGVGVILNIFNIMFKSRDQRRREAVARIAKRLRKVMSEQRSEHVEAVTQSVVDWCEELVVTVVGDLELLAVSVSQASEEVDMALAKVEDRRLALDEAFGARILDWVVDGDASAVGPHLTGVLRGPRSLHLFVSEELGNEPRLAQLTSVLQVDVTLSVAG